ncbi:MAG: phytoene/squalene synthase family protein [Solirubrobacteraceae bacterium]|nr:phytoene/squalene synthase family protein [Patulibacter sp.]
MSAPTRHEHRLGEGLAGRTDTVSGTCGPSAPAGPGVHVGAVIEEARATHRAVGKTFWLASRMLPRVIRDDVHLLYLVLRTLDDAVDDAWPDATGVVGAVEDWAHGGAPTSREASIFDHLAARYPIDPAVVADFCAGMRDDLTPRVLVDEDAVDEYCYRVAGTVGVLMTALLGADDVDAARRPAIALGQAMQRTNILRDIDEDLANGRLYLAADTVDAFGSVAPGRRADLLRDQIARADALYDEGLAGLHHLRSGRRAIAAAGAMYRQILRQLEREGLGEQPGRAVVSLPRKVGAAVRVQRGLSDRAAARGRRPVARS